jgi:hypothetical protein
MGGALRSLAWPEGMKVRGRSLEKATWQAAISLKWHLSRKSWARKREVVVHAWKERGAATHCMRLLKCVDCCNGHIEGMKGDSR